VAAAWAMQGAQCLMSMGRGGWNFTENRIPWSSAGASPSMTRARNLASCPVRPTSTRRCLWWEGWSDLPSKMGMSGSTVMAETPVKGTVAFSRRCTQAAEGGDGLLLSDAGEGDEQLTCA